MKLYSDNNPNITQNGGVIETNFIGGIYAHGKLERKLRYDLLHTTNEKLSNMSSINNKYTKTRFKAKVKVVDNNGKEHDALLFAWIPAGKEHGILLNKYKGLVVLPEDKYSVKYAKWCIDKRTPYL